MEQIIVTHLNNTTLKLQSKENLSAITRANQQVELLGADTVDISLESATKLNFYIGDKITIIGRDYTLNTPAKERKISERRFVYDLQFEGVQYDLLRASYSVNVDTTNNEIQDLSGDSLTGDLKMFLDVLISNANRVFPYKWVLGTYPLETETKTLTFSDSDNCLSVLQSLCSEANFNTEFAITIGSNGVRTLNIGTIGNVFPFTFEYGRGKGIYELTREKMSSTNIVTRLSVYGSSRNINTSKYRAFRLCLPNKTKSQSYIESATGIAGYGIWEQTKNFENVYPHREGEVTSFDKGASTEFIDSTMDFDLNEKDESGNTLYLISGASAKIHFNTGNLAGYEFEITEYNHLTKKFKFRPFVDESGYTFPSVTTSAFQPAVGDKYVILDIYLPQSYINTAEERLSTLGQEYLDKHSQPNVMYGLSLDPLFLKNVVGADVESNIVWVGDYMPIKDIDLDVDKSIRVKGFSRDLLKDYAYNITVSDLPVTVNTINRVVSELRGLDNLVRINNLADPARARRNYLNSQEVLSLIFDQEGDFYTEKIKPLSIDTSMLSVGAKYMQFGMAGTIFQPNYAGAKNRVVYTGGALSHYAILDTNNNPRTWTIANGDVVLGTDAAYYIYARCEKIGSNGSILFSASQLLVDSDLNYFHFLIGVINSAGANNERAIALMYGFSTINGRFIKTGRVQSADGSTYFDLDTGEISGKITFMAGSTGYNNLTDKPNLSVYSEKTYVDTLTANLQAQVDGQIMTFFENYEPTLANTPANTWTTDTERDKHMGDLFYNSVTGIGYRYSKISGVYSWEVLKDTEVATALANAAAAQTTANSKKRVFLVQPTTPYDAGDLWTQGAAGDLMRCKTTRLTGSYTAGDWEKAVGYTDDTAVNNLRVGGRNLISNSSCNGKVPVLAFNRLGSSSRLTVSNESDYMRLALNTTGSTDNFYQLGGTITSNPQGFVNNQNYVISFDAFFPSGFDITAKIQTYNYDTAWRLKNFEFTVERGVWKRYSIPFDFRQASGVGKMMRLQVPFGVTYNGEYFYIKNIKVEKGDKDTDWTPSPEEVDAQINEYSYLKEAMQNSTDIQGGLLSTTLIKLGAVNESGNWIEKAGINGAGTADSTPRLYAGGTLQQAINRIAGMISDSAKFVVTQGGKIFGMEVELFGSFSTAPAGGKRIHINHSAGAVNIHDESGDVKTTITSNAIPSIASLLAPNSSSVSAVQSILFNAQNDLITQTKYSADLILPITSSNYSITTPPIVCSIECSNVDNERAWGHVRARLITPSGYIELGSISVSLNSFGSESQGITIPSQVFETMSSGTYKIELYGFGEGTSANSTPIVSIKIVAPNDILAGVSVVEVSQIFRDGIFIIRDTNNYAYLSPIGIEEKSQVAPNRPGVLLSGRGLSGGGAAALWGPKKHATLTVAKSSTGTYLVYHSIGHSNFSVQVSPMDASRNVRWANPLTDRFTVYTYNGTTLSDANFSFTIFGDN